jgi:hypothetical protein
MAEPTFMFCLGATKAGTSWLWDHLAGHPECHFRTIKEYNFFFLSDGESFDNALRQGAQKIARHEGHLARLPADARVWAARHLTDLQAWQQVLQRRQVDLAAYREFLTEGRGARHLVGDITPAYGLLGGKRLRVMMDLAPDVRFLYLIRDPLARLWSHVRMVAANQAGDMAQAARGVLDRLLAGSGDNETKWLVERGDYPHILTKLDRILAGRPFRVQFYEDMMTGAGLAQVSAFLGISAQPGAFGRVSHQGVALALPDGYRGRLLAWLRPQYEFVAGRFGALPLAWQHSMKEAL